MRTSVFARAFVVALSVGMVTAAMPLSPAGANGTETLGPPSIALATGTGVAGGGTGLFAQPSSVSVNVPVNAVVKQTLIHWEGLSLTTPADNTIVVNGNQVTGTLIGGPTDFFFDQGDFVSTSSFRADITALGLVAPGITNLSISGLNNDYANDGASVSVIYDDGTAPATIQLRDGNDNAFIGFGSPLDTTVPQTFNFPASSSNRAADLALAVASVERDRPNAIKITVGSTSTTQVDLLASSAGEQWDHLVLPVAIPAGVTTVTVQILSQGDGSGRNPASLTWVSALLNVPTAAVPPVCTPSNTPAITHGSAYGVDASVLGLKLIDKLGRVSSVAPGAPASQASQLLTASVGTLVSAKVVGNTSNSALNPSRSTATSTVSDVSLLAGLVKATTIRGVSQSVASPNSASFNSNGSTIQGLLVNNVPVNVVPNTTVAVKALGLTVAELAIYKESGASTFAGPLSKASHSVNMLELTLVKPFLGFASGTKVIIAHADSDAQGPTSGCPTQKSVSGEAFTAFLDGDLGGTNLVAVKVGDAVLPPSGGANSDGTTVNVPGVATSSTAANTTSGSLLPNPNATSRSIVEGANVLSGLVTAQTLDVRSSSTANGVSASTTFATTFVNLKVGGATVTSNPAPNTTFFVPLPGGGFASVIINERTVGGNGTTDTEGTVNAVHVRVFALGGLLKGEVMVASAHSDAHV